MGSACYISGNNQEMFVCGCGTYGDNSLVAYGGTNIYTSKYKLCIERWPQLRFCRLILVSFNYSDSLYSSMQMFRQPAT